LETGRVEMAHYACHRVCEQTRACDVCGIAKHRDITMRWQAVGWSRRRVGLGWHATRAPLLPRLRNAYDKEGCLLRWETQPRRVLDANAALVAARRRATSDASWPSRGRLAMQKHNVLHTWLNENATPHRSLHAAAPQPNATASLTRRWLRPHNAEAAP